MNRFFNIVFLCVCGLTCAWGATDGERYARQSALATGKWVKIQVERTGVYKISDDDLRKMGFAEPQKVSVHGYGGWPLSEDFSQDYIDDLPATAVYRGSNYLLFYGKGTVKWEYDTSSATFLHTPNPYALYGYYFLTDATPTKEMETLPATESGASLAITIFDEYRLFEEELVSVNQSGRELFGRSFVAGGSYTFNSQEFRIPGITNDAAKVSMRFIARPRSNSGLASLLINGEALLNLSLPVVGNNSDDTYIRAVAASGTANWEGEKSENPTISVRYNKAGDENVHLDYIRLQVKRTLRQYGEYTFFRSLVSQHNIARFVVQNANANTLVWDVTDGLNPKRMETQLSGSELSFTIPAGGLREFVAIQADQALSGWKNAGEVRNQNLHALPQTDMVIIVQDALRSQAERLAERHRTADGLKVEVVNPQQIYNEFSSGTPDATAYRRFMKMFYDRSLSEDEKPRYLLLFGDGAYDNRGLTTAWKEQNTANMLLTYQSPNSLNQYSYATDDYFGALENTPFRTGLIQLGIGRFPVRTIEEATVTTDKVLAYSANTVTGTWKNRLCFVADDGSAADAFSTEHMDYANQLGERVRREYPAYLVNKIFFDAYKKSSSRYPDVRQNIQKQLKDGLFLINYTGHGSKEKWSDEDVLTNTDIAGFSHTFLPLWITATCDFTRFDDTSTSAGERVFLQKSGGIAMFTTSRVVYSANNFLLNNLLIGEIFKRDTAGRRPRLGDIMRNTKNDPAIAWDSNKLNFILIGDPAMTLSYPDYRLQVTAINGRQLSAADSVTFKALEKITVEGRVLQPTEDALASSFTGALNVSVFDSKQTIRTLDNNRSGVFEFIDYPNVLHVGNNRVNQGNFSFSFTVPKDISYSNDYGIMNLYAAADEQSGAEAQGTYSRFLVGGSAEHPEADNEGPQIRQLFLNDSTFREGGKVNTTPFFVARLWDQTGVNISGSSIGHDIILRIDNKPAWTYNLNAYYRLQPQTSGEGWVTFSIPSLPQGLHTAEFKVWDVANNPSEQTFSFEVVESLKPVLVDAFATPVPARENVQFQIYHNLPESPLTIRVMVYDMNGRLLWQGQENGASALSAPYTLDWNLSSSSGSRLRPGIYIYRAAIRTAGSEEVSRSRKLVILAQ